MCSSSSETDKPSLVERILEVPKNYIYLPEKGEIIHTDTDILFKAIKLWPV